MFSVKFNHYLKTCKCSAKTMAKMTNISEATISRYRSGKTVPSISGGNIEIISESFAVLLKEKQRKNEIYEELLVAAYEDLEMVDYKVYSEKLALLVEKLNINQNRMAQEIHISASHLSKICRAQSKPRNPVYIADSVAHYVIYHYPQAEQRHMIQSLIWGEDACLGDTFSTIEYEQAVKKWLLSGNSEKSLIADNLLYKYGEYNKDMFFHYPGEKSDYKSDEKYKKKDIQTFFRVEGLKRAFYTWFEMACDSKLNDEIIIYDDIISAVARNNPKVAYEYSCVVEKLIKMGKKLTIINNLENDLYTATKKVLLWLPLNMSGRISHYYIDESKEKIYRNLLMVSSNCAFIGNVVDGNLEQGYYSLVTSYAEVAIAKARAEMILRKAFPTYTYYNNQTEFENQIEMCYQKIEKDDRVSVYLPVPPALTMKEELLIRILKRNGMSEAQIKTVLKRYHMNRQRIEAFLGHQQFDIHIDHLSREKWEKDTIKTMIYSDDGNVMMSYKYEEYQEHLRDTMEFTHKHANASLQIEKLDFYKNMILLFVPGKFALVSKINSPEINMICEDTRVLEAVEELMAVVSKATVDEIMNNEKRKELYFFFRNFVSQ